MDTGVLMASDVNIIGTNNTTPGAATAPSTLLTDTSSTTGLLIKQGSGAPAGQKAFQLNTQAGDVFCEFDFTTGLSFINQRVGAAAGVFTAVPTCLNGVQNPPCLQFADGTANGMRLWSGTGVPSSTTVGNGQVGDRYLRRDTPLTALQRVYRCTVAGTPGTWGGIA